MNIILKYSKDKVLAISFIEIYRKIVLLIIFKLLIHKNIKNYYMSVKMINICIIIN